MKAVISVKAYLTHTCNYCHTAKVIYIKGSVSWTNISYIQGYVLEKKQSIFFSIIAERKLGILSLFEKFSQ